MRPAVTGRFVAFTLISILIPTAQTEKCYSYMGFEVEDQQLCKGSGACCGVNDECMPNRLCKARGSADNVLVRGPCSSKSWDKERNCAEICNFSKCLSRNFVWLSVLFLPELNTQKLMSPTR
ncbi:hypothetical protein LIA77_00545 [Sarocladium implicatum]|nr:hypothetical protein LIA77_00545 [Sarocladium implicatum]